MSTKTLLQVSENLKKYNNSKYNHNDNIFPRVRIFVLTAKTKSLRDRLFYICS